MKKKFDFKLTPAYCLYNGVAVLKQQGAYIRFLIENKNDAVLCGRLSRAFENHVGNVRSLKDCPEDFQRLIKIDFEPGTRSQLRKAVSRLYMAETTAGEKELVDDSSKNRRESAAVLLLDSILNEARLRNATDIHIENNCVRLRINGRLEKLLKLQTEKSSELVQRIKLLSGMNVIESRRCQDGQFVYGNKNPFFVRVSTMSVVGEKNFAEESVVLRLLDTSRIPLSIEELGFNHFQLEKICGKSLFSKASDDSVEPALIDLPNGLFLLCGPTGSGKSTSVAALLLEIEKKRGGALKIISLEDPPEYIIPGVSQVKVDERNSFSDALNHVFRQDPDVIMIGEIRDEESAAAALRASLTGHLVFATLHSGSAAESILRLENLGMDRRLLCQVLRAVISQDLNMLGGKMSLIADLAIPKANFSEKACKEESAAELENLMEHFTNYSEVLSQTVQTLKEEKEKAALKKTEIKGDEVSADFGRLKKKSIEPVYRRRRKGAGIHKGAV